MRAPLYLALIALTACGGKKTSDTTPVTTDDDSATPTEVVGDGETYGGEVEEEEREPPEPEPPQPPDLTGMWVGPCSPTAADPKVNGTFTFNITADAWTLDMERFSDAACTKRTWVMHETGTYTIGEASTAVPGAWSSDRVFGTRTLTADDKATAKKLGKTCKVKLTAKKALDITAKGCPALKIMPLADCAGAYDLVAVTGTQLQFGAHPADNDLCTEDKRPTALMEHGVTWTWKPNGVADCDAYAAKSLALMACDKMPAAARDAVFQSLRAMGASWGDLSTAPDDVKKETGDACKQAVDGLSQSMAAVGC